jgi:hypothetical protein
MSVASVNQNSSIGELDDVEDKMPEISAKKVCLKIIDHKINEKFIVRKKSI